MKEIMKAAVIREYGKVGIEEVPVPKIGPKDILVKVKAGAICGSDVHIFDSGAYAKEFPLIMGHEFSSEVVKMGKEVEGLSVGDRVMGLNIDFCGECWWCKNGDYHCPNIVKSGIGFFEDGAFAEYLKINDARVGFNVHKIPENLTDEEAALIEPCSVGVGNVDTIDVQEGDRVVVIGAGIIGLGALAAAKARGAEVAVINRSKGRLELAKKMGADHTFSTLDGDPVEWIINLWGNGIFPYHYDDMAGGMADVVIEAVGAPSTFTWAFDMIRSGGKICVAGTATHESTIHPKLILMKDPKILSGLAGNFAKSAQYLSEGIIDPKLLISHIYKFDDVQEAFEMAKNTKESMKVILKIEGDA